MSDCAEMWDRIRRRAVECKYHVVFLPKDCHERLYGRVRHEAGKIQWELRRRKGLELLEGKAMPDHVHLLLCEPRNTASHTRLGF